MSEVQPLKDRMFQKLASIVKERFDSVITFTDFGARMRVSDAKSSSTVQRNSHSNYIVSGNDVLLPVRANGNLFGFVTVFNGIHLREMDIDQIRDVTDMLLTESCMLEDKNHKIKLMEHYLSHQMSPEEIADIRGRIDMQEIQYLTPEISVPPKKLDHVFPIMIQCHQETDALEFSLEVHKASDRGTFLTYEPYLNTELSSVETIMAMGPVTLFISNITKLPIDLQVQISNYLSSPLRTTLHPRIIVSSLEAPETLIAQGVMEATLFDKVSSARLKLPPKGTSTMGLDEILEFFNPELMDHKPARPHLYLVSNADSQSLN